MRLRHPLAILCLILTSVVALRVDGQVMSKVVVNGHAAAAAPTSPTGISGLLFWYSADCINAGACASQPTNGSAITTWKDRSTNTNDLTCSGSPTFTTNELNSLPAVVAVSASSQSCAFGTAITWPGAETIFAVFKTPSGTNGEPIVSSSNTGALMYQINSNVQNFTKVFTLSIASGNHALEDGAFHQINGTFTTPSGAYAFRYNEGADASGTGAVTSITAAQNLMFYTEGGPYADITLCEVFAYNSVVSGANITAMETYLHTKYGI